MGDSIRGERKSAGSRKFLSPRLGALLERGLDGEDFWDMCCDHGLLGAGALRTNRFSKVHFVDRVPHVMTKLESRFADREEVSVHTSCAGEIVGPITGTVSLAGVGGFNLIKILSRWEERGNLHARRLLLNPLTHITELRDFLSVWPGYAEVETAVVNERGRLREIIVLDKTE